MGVGLIAAAIGLFSLLLGPSSVDNVEVRRIVPYAIALDAGIGIVFIITSISLIPFANFSEDVEGHLLNVLLFVLLGLLVSLFCENRHGILPVAAMAFATSLVVEVRQLLFGF